MQGELEVLRKELEAGQDAPLAELQVPLEEAAAAAQERALVVPHVAGLRDRARELLTAANRMEKAALEARLGKLEAEYDTLLAKLPLQGTAMAQEWAIVPPATAQFRARAEELQAQARRLEEALEEREAALAQDRADAADAAEVQRHLARRGNPEWRDWAGLPEHVLMKVAGKLVAQNEAGWAAYLTGALCWPEKDTQEEMAERKRDGNCLFVFARVCKGWRKARLKVGGRLCTRVRSDVILPGRVALAKWALAEGCPRDDGSANMTHFAASCGHLELGKWLCGEGGFEMDEGVAGWAAHGGNLELVQWLRGEGCPWNRWTCFNAVFGGHVEVLRWVRENGCPWDAETRNEAAWKLGYKDDLGNLVEYQSLL